MPWPKGKKRTLNPPPLVFCDRAKASAAGKIGGVKSGEAKRKRREMARCAPMQN